MKAIFNHFNSLGGLYNVSQENLLDTRIFNDEIKLIEEYLKRDIPKLLWNILKKYQGHTFNDEVGFNVTTNIPILGNSTFLEFGQFLSLCQEASLYLLDVLENNSDIFGHDFLPFAEATPGDYIALNISEQSVYFISHDFSDNEQSQIKIANSLKDYFLHLCKHTVENRILEKRPRITSVEYSNDLLSLMQEWKNKETSNKER